MANTIQEDSSAVCVAADEAQVCHYSIVHQDALPDVLAEAAVAAVPDAPPTNTLTDSSSGVPPQSMASTTLPSSHPVPPGPAALPLETRAIPQCRATDHIDVATFVSNLAARSARTKLFLDEASPRLAYFSERLDHVRTVAR